jgi:orotate phosphoribosyltransferase
MRRDKKAIVRRVAEASTLRGEFVLRSGKVASTYFDKYQFEAQPLLLDPISRWMAGLLEPDVELLAGLELGGVPLATAISLRTGIPTVFVRKEAKSYGTCKAIEGPSVKGKRVTIIEDVVTTGGAILEAVEKLRSAGAHVNLVVCAIWRGTTLKELHEKGIELKWTLVPADLQHVDRFGS